MEPNRLRCWRLPSGPGSGVFYSCARPGRSKGNRGQVPDQLLHAWVRGLPEDGNLAIVSLLGEKPDGTSEYSFYSFYKKRQTFQDWLDKHYPDKRIEVVEHPTTEFKPVPAETLSAVAAEIRRLLTDGRTVVLVDLGGAQRSGQVCRYINATEDTTLQTK